MTPELTKREHFAAMFMSAMIPAQQEKFNLYDISQNTEDCCGEVAAAACRMADELIFYLDNINIRPRSPAFGKTGKVIELPK